MGVSVFDDLARERKLRRLIDEAEDAATLLEERADDEAALCKNHDAPDWQTSWNCGCNHCGRQVEMVLQAHHLREAAEDVEPFATPREAAS